MPFWADKHAILFDKLKQEKKREEPSFCCVLTIFNMRVLITGYGNVGKAIEALLKNSHNTVVSSIELCDESIYGINAQQWLENYHDRVDVVINVTGEPPWEILSLCQRYHLDYIDTAIELPSEDTFTVIKKFLTLRAMSSSVRTLIGFGMNPGLIEFMYYLNAPKREHIAIELEYDSAIWKKEQLFNTWDPVSYFEESTDNPCFYTNKNILFFSSQGINIDVPLCMTGIQRIFNPVPHQEIVTIGLSNQYCKLCAFLYQGPVVMQQFLKQHWQRLTKDELENIDVPGDGITGYDTIGMLIHNGSQHVTYYFTQASHAECSTKFKDGNAFGVNATNWQVACGVYVALEMLSLLTPGVYTMTDIAPRFVSQIEKILAEVQFSLKRKEFHVEEIGWHNIEQLFLKGTGTAFYSGES